MKSQIRCFERMSVLSAERIFRVETQDYVGRAPRSGTDQWSSAGVLDVTMWLM
jgi:hypothetical protein